ncbi:MAG: hypothetical protein ACFB9M_16265 [Myxococcota bacterium]
MNAVWMIAHMMMTPMSASPGAEPVVVHAETTPATARIVRAKADHEARVARAAQERALFLEFRSASVDRSVAQLSIPEVRWVGLPSAVTLTKAPRACPIQAEASDDETVANKASKSPTDDAAS